MSNMRLIDANKLFEKVGRVKPRNKEHYKAIGEFMNMITNSETIDIEDCISRKWLFNKIHDYAEADTTSTEESIGADYCAEFVKDAPSAVPSRPTGKWYIIEYEYFTCDQCGEYVWNGAEYTQEAREMLKNGDFPNYCPNCGAKMEGEE